MRLWGWMAFGHIPQGRPEQPSATFEPFQGQAAASPTQPSLATRNPRLGKAALWAQEPAQPPLCSSLAACFTRAESRLTHSKHTSHTPVQIQTPVSAGSNPQRSA